MKTKRYNPLTALALSALLIGGVLISGIGFYVLIYPGFQFEKTKTSIIHLSKMEVKWTIK